MKNKLLLLLTLGCATFAQGANLIDNKNIKNELSQTNDFKEIISAISQTNSWSPCLYDVDTVNKTTIGISKSSFNNEIVKIYPQGRIQTTLVPSFIKAILAFYPSTVAVCKNYTDGQTSMRCYSFDNNHTIGSRQVPLVIAQLQMDCDGYNASDAKTATIEASASKEAKQLAQAYYNESFWHNDYKLIIEQKPSQKEISQR
ncbi:hypothetical protein HOB95_03580, partial [bacterium]|nr:hypothetical protein [bacterium]